MRHVLIATWRGCLRCGVWLLALGLCACLDNKLAEMPEGERTVFIAQQRDFGDYLDWMTFAHDVTNEHGGVVGTTTVYLNELPPSDAATFPIGTMLVKTMQPVDAGNLNIHAMVKRGSGFNAKGALGWEFFELALAKKNGVPYILWRGANPPTGEQYKLLLGAAELAPMEEETDCNDCHAHAKDGTFDSVADLLK